GRGGAGARAGRRHDRKPAVHVGARRPHGRPDRGRDPSARGGAGRPSGGDRMKAVILAGGTGTRISEETALRPKPMIEIGGVPILWHIMTLYAAHGIDEFVVCLGYRGY